MPNNKFLPNNKLESRRVKEDGRIVILPPEGFGDRWTGDGTGAAKRIN